MHQDIKAAIKQESEIVESGSAFSTKRARTAGISQALPIRFAKGGWLGGQPWPPPDRNCTLWRAIICSSPIAATDFCNFPRAAIATERI